MKNLLPRVLWDYLVGAIVAVAAMIIIFIFVGFASLMLGRPSESGELLREGLTTLGFVTLLSVLLVVTIYELVMWRRAQGKMLEPGSTESRVLSREVIVRAGLSGAEAGVYMSVVAIVFALLARGANELSPVWVLLIGLLPAVMLIAAGALAFAYVGHDVQKHIGELELRGRTGLLMLPLALAVTSGFLFGAAAGGAWGVVSAIVGAVLTYLLVRILERLHWHTVGRSLEGLLQSRGGPSIKVVSTHKA
jgi:hypothetical protein